MLLMDASESMAVFDPNDFRSSAIRFYSNLVPQGSYAGVYQFSTNVETLAEFSKVTPAFKKLIAASGEKLHTQGIMTRLDLALEFAISKLAHLEGEKHVIMVSDGIVDAGQSESRSKMLRKTLIERIVPQLAKLNIHVHIITNQSGTDLPLLNLISQKTQGVMKPLKRIDGISQSMMHVFDRISYQAYEHNLSKEHFDVRNHAKSVSIIINDPEAAPVLVDPEGQEYRESNKVKTINWVRDNGYQLIEIKSPIAGRWFLKSARDLDNRIIVGSDFKLKVSEIPHHVFSREHVILSVALVSDGKIVKNQNILKFIRFSVKDLAGDSQSEGYRMSSANHDGIYKVNFILDKPGMHELMVVAKSPSFSRSMRRLIKVFPVPIRVAASKSDIDGGHEINVYPNSKLLKPHRTEVKALISYQGKNSVKVLPFNNERGTWQFKLAKLKAGKAYSVFYRLQGRDDSGRNFHFQTDPHLVYSDLKMYVDMKQIQPQHLPHHLPMIYRLDSLSQEYIAKLAQEAQRVQVTHAKIVKKKRAMNGMGLNKQSIKVVKSEDPMRDFFIATVTGLLLIVLLVAYLSSKSRRRKKFYKEMNDILIS